MNHHDAPGSSGRDTYVTIVLCAFVGIPLFAFFNILTGGLFLWLLLGALGIGMFGIFHYLLWGRAFSQETAGEREEEALRAEMESDESSSGQPDAYRDP